jgi:hypothetical protein
VNGYRRFIPTYAFVALVALLGAECKLAAAEPERKRTAPQPTAVEARGRAELLHETFHGVLQVVHHQYYREDEGLPIPAATLKKVFQELASRKQVDVRWLAVNAAPMNLDHVPQNDFERKAVAALAEGNDAYESIEQGVYRRVAAITLTNECLKCHAPNRSSTKDRIAGLSISMPVAQPMQDAPDGR